MEQRSHRQDGLLISLLGPQEGTMPPAFSHVRTHHADYEAAIVDIQRFRGRVYVEDRAIPPSSLDHEGRHRQDFDYENWHMYTTDASGQIMACIRVRHTPEMGSPQQLKLHEVVSRWSASHRRRCFAAIDQLLERSREAGMGILEISGWAVDARARNSRKGVMLAMACWSICRLLGHAFGISVSTNRHRTTDILRRLGGTPLRADDGPLPLYFDPYYRCEMELMCFDSRAPHPGIEAHVERIRAVLSRTPVLTGNASARCKVTFSRPVHGVLPVGEHRAAAGAGRNPLHGR